MRVKIDFIVCFLISVLTYDINLTFDDPLLSLISMYSFIVVVYVWHIRNIV